MSAQGGKGVGDVLPDGRLRQHPLEPSTFEGMTPDSGMDWFGAMMNAHARVSGELGFIVFALGQLGALHHKGTDEQIEQMLDVLEIDCRDFEDAAKLYADTVRALAGNVRRNAEQGTSR